MNDFLFWISSGTILLLLELNVPGTFLFLIAGISCCATLIFSYLKFKFKYQVGLFFLIFTIIFLITKKIFNIEKTRQFSNKNTQTNLELLVEKTGTVIKEINSKNPGIVKINGETWRAKIFDIHEKIEVDSKVKVIKIEGNSIFVIKK